MIYDFVCLLMVKWIVFGDCKKRNKSLQRNGCNRKCAMLTMWELSVVFNTTLSLHLFALHIIPGVKGRLDCGDFESLGRDRQIKKCLIKGNIAKWVPITTSRRWVKDEVRDGSGFHSPHQPQLLALPLSKAKRTREMINCHLHRWL